MESNDYRIKEVKSVKLSSDVKKVSSKQYEVTSNGINN